MSDKFASPAQDGHPYPHLYDSPPHFRALGYPVRTASLI